MNTYPSSRKDRNGQKITLEDGHRPASKPSPSSSQQMWFFLYKLEKTQRYYSLFGLFLFEKYPTRSPAAFSNPWFHTCTCIKLQGLVVKHWALQLCSLWQVPTCRGQQCFIIHQISTGVFSPPHFFILYTVKAGPSSRDITPLSLMMIMLSLMSQDSPDYGPLMADSFFFLKYECGQNQRASFRFWDSFGHLCWVAPPLRCDLWLLVLCEKDREAPFVFVLLLCCCFCC